MDLSHTIIPKSNQLNADDLISGPMTITVTDVDVIDAPDQPLSIHYDGENGRPYKPCKSMRRVLIQAWGNLSSDFIGKSMTLYRDSAVKFAGEAVGGIRISHLSHIKRDMKMVLTVTRAKRAPYHIKKMDAPQASAAPTESEKPDNYPSDKFNADKARIKTAIESGRSTPEAIIEHMEKTAPLTKDQRKWIGSIEAPTPESEAETEDIY